MSVPGVFLLGGKKALKYIDRGWEFISRTVMLKIVQLSGYVALLRWSLLLSLRTSHMLAAHV